MSDIRRYAPLWEQWEIEDLIGEGHGTKVYRAVRATPQGKVYAAIKQFELAPDANPAVSERKARVLLALVDKQIALRGKPHLAEYYERQAYRREDGGYDVFVRMELLTSLRSVMGKTEFSEAMLSQLGQELSAGLIALEDAGTCHGAVHPGNIFLSRDGTYKLGDFCRTGARKVSGAAREYQAPEVLTGSSLPSASADRYALGMVLYRLANGLRGPFLPPAPQQVSREQIADAERSRLRGEALPAPQGASPRIAAILSRACAGDKAQRYPSTDELRRDFLRLQDPDAEITAPQQPVKQKQQEPQMQKTGKKKKHRILIPALIAAALLIAAGVTGWLLSRNAKPQPTEPVAHTVTAPETSATGKVTTEAPTTETATTEPTTTEPETTAAPTYAFELDRTRSFVDFEVPASGYIIEDSNTRYITTDDLKGMTANQCRLACNEIYARHGRIFSGAVIADYFGAMPWYSGTVDGSYFDNHIYSYLSDIEIANANTILRYERSQGWQ